MVERISIGTPEKPVIEIKSKYVIENLPLGQKCEWCEGLEDLVPSTTNYKRDEGEIVIEATNVPVYKCVNNNNWCIGIFYSPQVCLDLVERTQEVLAERGISTSQRDFEAEKRQHREAIAQFPPMRDLPAA